MIISRKNESSKASELARQSYDYLQEQAFEAAVKAVQTGMYESSISLTRQMSGCMRKNGVFTASRPMTGETGGDADSCLVWYEEEWQTNERYPVAVF